ncbi:hypothetical protein P7C71_g5918, partial [Lecanoromycetidae sp. Uapishka_2]
MLAGLQSEIPDLPRRASLTVHVVGATEEELLGMAMAEELLHLLPNLEDVVVGYVGPELGIKKGPTKLQDLECCPECQGMGRTRKIFLSDSLYHDFTHSSIFDSYKPDLIIAYHSGHHEVETDTWWPTLNLILDSGTPAVFTTYNEQEALGEEKVFDGMGARFTKRMEKNRWSGVLPYFDNTGERYAKYYLNNYWYIVKGGQSDRID